MFNPNSMNNSGTEHDNSAEAETLKADELNKKLGDLASSRSEEHTSELQSRI